MAELNDSLCEEDIVQENGHAGKPFVLFNHVSNEVSEAKDLNDSLDEEEFKTLSQLQSPSFLQKEVTTECLKKIKGLNDSLDEGETGCKNGIEKTSFKSPGLDLNKSNNNAVDIRFHSEEILHCSAVASVITQQSPKESAHSPMGVPTGRDIKKTPPIQNSTAKTNRAKVKPSFGKKTKKPSVPAGQADSDKNAVTSTAVSKKQKTTSAKKSDKSRDVGNDMKQKSFDKGKLTKSQLSKTKIKTDENVEKPESTLLSRDLATLDPKTGTNTEKVASRNGIVTKPNFSAKKSFSSDANVKDQVIDSERTVSRKEVPKKPQFSMKKAFSSDATNKEHVSDSEKMASKKPVPKKPDFSVKKACISDADKKDKVGGSEKIASKSEISKKPDFSVKKMSSMEASKKDKVSNSDKPLTKASRKKIPGKPDIPVEKICSSDASSSAIGDQASEKLLPGEIQVKSSQENQSPDQTKEVLSLDSIQEEKMPHKSGQSPPLHNNPVTGQGIQKKPKRKPLSMEERAEIVKKRKLKNEEREREKEQKRIERESKKKEKEEEKARKKEKREALKAVRQEMKAELEKKRNLKAQQKKNSESDSSLVSPDKREDIVFPEDMGDKLEVQLDAFRSDDSSIISLNLTSPFSRTSNPLPSSEERPATAVTSKQPSLEETTAVEARASSSSSETRSTTLTNLKRPSLEATTASEPRAKRLKSEDSDTTTDSDSTFILSSEMESGIVMLDSPNGVSTDQSDPSPPPVSKRKPRAKTRIQANMTGPVWVQCCNIYCRKWRQLKGHFDPLSVPAFWKCSDNTDQEYNHCSVPTEEWVGYENEEFQFVESAYIPGSVVWAKMDSYPWWPAMIEADPDEECYFEMGHSDSIVPVKYHVVFFGTPVSRSWLNACRVIPYTDVVDANEVHHCHVTKSFKKSLEESKADATRAVTMHVKERLEEYGFLKRHKVTKKSQCQDSAAEAKPKSQRGRPRKLQITLTKAERKAMSKNVGQSFITSEQTSKSDDSSFGDRSNTSGSSEDAMETDASSEIQYYQEGDKEMRSCLNYSKGGATHKQQKLSSAHED